MAQSEDGETLGKDAILPPARLVMVNSAYWGIGGVQLTVGFMETIASDLRIRIMEHFNAWGTYCNATFTYTASTDSAQVRVTRSGWGYWSYLGTDILSIPSNQPTMSLGGFTMSYPESEFKRVIRHEVGHTMGFHHEHLRAALVAKLDVQATLDYFSSQYGWTVEMVYQNVLTPLEEASVTGSATTDANSIMCYSLPAEITIDHQPIVGGTNITANDGAFAQTLYPGIANPEPPPPPPPPSGIEQGELIGGLVWIDRPAPQDSAVGFPHPGNGYNDYINFTGNIGVAAPFTIYTSMCLRNLNSYGNSFALLYYGDEVDTFECNAEMASAGVFEQTEVAIVCNTVTVETGLIKNVLAAYLMGRDKKNGSLQFIAKTSTEFEIEADVWFTLAVTYSGSGTRAGIKLYHDGLPITSNTGAASSSKGLVKVRHYVTDDDVRMRALCAVGPNPGFGGSGFEGGVVERFAFFGKALSATAIKKLNDEQVAGDSENITEGISHKFPIDEGSGDKSYSIDGTVELDSSVSAGPEHGFWKSLGDGKYAMVCRTGGFYELGGLLEPIGADGTSPFSFVMKIKSLPYEPGYTKSTTFMGRNAGGGSGNSAYFFKNQESASPRGFEFSIIDSSQIIGSNYAYAWARSTKRLPRGVWTVVGLTYDGSLTAQGMNMFMDGTQLKVIRVNNGTPTFTPAASGIPFVLGSDLCEIDWIVFWNRVLTPNEMKAASEMDLSEWEPGVTPIVNSVTLLVPSSEGS